MGVCVEGWITIIIPTQAMIQIMIIFIIKNPSHDPNYDHSPSPSHDHIYDHNTNPSHELNHDHNQNPRHDPSYNHNPNPSHDPNHGHDLSHDLNHS